MSTQFSLGIVSVAEGLVCVGVGLNNTNVLPEMGRRVALFGAAVDADGDFVLISDAGDSGIVAERYAVSPRIPPFVQKLTKVAPNQLQPRP